MICYMGMGWCIIFAVVPTYHALGLGGFLLLVAGGLLYTFGAILYGLGIKHRYMHSVSISLLSSAASRTSSA